MRVLAVVSDELLGADDARDWAFLEFLVAVNSPASIDVEVLALINQPAASIATANPLGRAAGRLATGSEAYREPYDPAASARQRLDRSLLHLRSLGLRATGDIEPGDDPYRLVRRKAAGGTYDPGGAPAARQAAPAGPVAAPRRGSPAATFAQRARANCRPS